MELLVNDLSFHGQFEDLASFRESIERLIEIKRIAARFGRPVACHRKVAQARVSGTMMLPQAINQWLDVNEKRALMQWLTRQGPFWEDDRIHGQDDWFEFNGDLVTDSAVGEAAGRILAGIDTRLISLSPSAWMLAPIPVVWVADGDTREDVRVDNYWDPNGIENALSAAPALLRSWAELGNLAVARCGRLTFSSDAFKPLEGHPFNQAAAQRLLFLIGVLNRLTECFTVDGERTEEGHRLYRDFFTGKKGNGGIGAIFSDSSDGEKSAFKKEMTFVHPADEKQTLSCTWHGKVQTPKLRFHFSYPVRYMEPVFVCYVGPKITKV